MPYLSCKFHNKPDRSIYNQNKMDVSHASISRHKTPEPLHPEPPFTKKKITAASGLITSICLPNVRTLRKQSPVSLVHSSRVIFNLLCTWRARKRLARFIDCAGSRKFCGLVSVLPDQQDKPGYAGFSSRDSMFSAS